MKEPVRISKRKRTVRKDHAPHLNRKERRELAARIKKRQREQLRELRQVSKRSTGEPPIVRPPVVRDERKEEEKTDG